MATLTLDFATAAVEDANGNYTWAAPLTEILQSTNNSPCDFINSTYTLGNTLGAHGHANSGTLPGNYSVDNIKVQIKCLERGLGTGEYQLMNMGISHEPLSSGFSTGGLSTTKSTHSWSGNLSYWGINNAQARAFIEETFPSQYGDSGTGNSSLWYFWAQAERIGTWNSALDEVEYHEIQVEIEYTEIPPTPAGIILGDFH